MANGASLGFPPQLREVRLLLGCSLLFVLAERAPYSLLQLAGLVARGNIHHVHTSCTDIVRASLRGMSIGCLADAEANIRRTANNLVSTLARQSRALEEWKELFPALVSLTENPNPL